MPGWPRSSIRLRNPRNGKPRTISPSIAKIAEAHGRIAGLLVSRSVADKEREILNIAVHPDFRRLHIATELLRAEISRWPGAHFLEVRESNAAARRLYEVWGFKPVGNGPRTMTTPPKQGLS